MVGGRECATHADRQRFAEAQAQPETTVAGREKRFEQAGQHIGGDAWAAVAYGQLTLAGTGMYINLQRACAGRHLRQRLQGIAQQVVDDLFQRHRLGKYGGCSAAELRFDLQPAQLRLKQVQGITHGGFEADGLQLTGDVRPFNDTAQAADHIGCAARLFCCELHCRAGGGELRRVIVEQAACGLGVGEYGGQRLVEFMGNTRSELAQGIEARDLTEAQQFFGT